MTQPLIIYGYASGCPACDKLKQLLDLLSIPYKFTAISRTGGTRELLRKAGFDTVPAVFTSEGEHVGGLSEFRKVARLGIQGAGLLG